MGDLLKFTIGALKDKSIRLMKFEKYLISRIENLSNLGTYQFYKISEVLQSAYIVPRDTKSNTFYVSNYIDRDKFNQL